MHQARFDRALSGTSVHPHAVATRIAVSSGNGAGALRKLAGRPHRRARQSRHRSARVAHPGAHARTGDPRTRAKSALGMARQSGWGRCVSFPDINGGLRTKIPALRGRLLVNQSLAELTWFRVGGPAQVLFMPEDEKDLSYLLANLPDDVPVTTVGLGSNLIVRDGGIAGVVVRLGRGFNDVAVEGMRIRAGAAVPD